MVVVTPGINLGGKCAEAIALYEKAFGARTDLLLRYSDADPADWDAALTDEQKDWVYHAEVYIGDQRMMFSDVIESDPTPGVSLFLVLTFDDADTVKKAYGVLEEGSTIVSPMTQTTYSSCFVSLVDKFGLRWVLMTEQTER
jgi:PhnB protein